MDYTVEQLAIEQNGLKGKQQVIEQVIDANSRANANTINDGATWFSNHNELHLVTGVF